MKKLANNQQGFSFEILLVLLALCVIGAVGYLVSYHLDYKTSSNSTGQNKTAKLTYFPDMRISYLMPTSWKVTNSYSSTSGYAQEIESSNKTSEKNICEEPGAVAVGSAPSVPTCPPKVNISDAIIGITEEPAKGATSIQQWTTARDVDPNVVSGPLYVLTKLNDQPAECLNTTGGSTLIPKDIPSNIPKGLYIGTGCSVLWKNNVYIISVENLYDINTDNKQIFNLIESIKFI